MSQPEMRPEGVSRKGGAGGDLVGRTFPLGDWGEPAERLDELYVWAEQRALRIADWYLTNRLWKRRGARALRAGTAVGVTVGAVLPLLTATGSVSGRCAAWGYLALLGAAVCVAGDRYFGLTRGWMRDVGTAQAVQRRLESLQYEWATESIREMLGPTEGTACEAADRALAVLRRFTEDMTEIVGTETADWMLEFRSGPAPLRPQPVSVASATGHGEGLLNAANGHRFPPAPGSHPTLPRQRPPEGPH